MNGMAQLLTKINAHPIKRFNIEAKALQHKGCASRQL